MVRLTGRAAATVRCTSASSTLEFADEEVGSIDNDESELNKRLKESDDERPTEASMTS